MAFRRLASGLGRNARRFMVVGLVAAGATAPIACSGNGDAGEASGPAPTPATRVNGVHAIHVFAVQPDGSKTRLDFGPGTEMPLGDPNQGAPPVASQSTGLQLLDLSGGSAVGLQGGGVHLLATDGGTGIVSSPTIDNPGSSIGSTAWALVSRAAVGCDPGHNAYLPPFSTDPDGRNRFFVFANAGSSCADRLENQQTLLCIADKLAGIADAVGTVDWPAVDMGCAGAPVVYGRSDAGTQPCTNGLEWIIPPQADSDRFIVRDLAIHTLGMIPTLDSVQIINPGTGTTPSTPLTCATLLGVFANNTPVTSDGLAVQMFGVSLLNGQGGPSFPYFPPSSLPLISNPGTASAVNNTPAIARADLLLEAQILRSGGKLLHDLVRRDVYSDLAAAAKESGQAMDPDKGNLIAWGASDQGPYGTIAHAARVLLGRWEIGNFSGVSEPSCEGVAPIDLLPKALGSDFAARIDDRPVRTPGEELAAQLVEEAGIVIPTCGIDKASPLGAGGPSPLRTILADQLLVASQSANAMTINVASPQHAMFDRILANISEGELVFAFKRALRTFLLVTSSVDNTNPAACAPLTLSAGLTAATAVAPNMTKMNGIVVKGAMGRARLATDPMARAGGMLEASQCQETTGQWTEWGAQIWAPTYPTRYPSGPTPWIPAATFQDAFHMGQAFERRLALLRNASDAVKGGPGDPEAVARGGVAEIQSWAGSTTVHSWVAASAPGGANALQVRIAGLPASSLGLAPGTPAATRQQAVQNAFGFVYGPPWVAECATHTRQDCPVGFDAAYIQYASAVVADAADPPLSVGPYQQINGVVGPVYQLTVPLTPTAVNGSPAPASWVPKYLNGVTTSHTYMIRLHEPADPAGRGRVLGTLPLPAAPVVAFPAPPPSPALNLISSFVDAPMQRELVHDALDLGQWVGARPPRLGDPSAAQTSGYCVDGVRRDIFVPLDNELSSSSTSFENSWQHYLDLATQAAQHADDLAQQLITQDFEITQNQQAAAESLAGICGDFGMLSGVTVGTDGKTSAATEDPTTSICLSEPLDDIVFLGSLPADPKFAADPTSYIRQTVLNCPSGPPASTDPLCDAVTKPTITYAALNLAPNAVPPPPMAPRMTGWCSGIAGLAASTQTGLNAGGLRQLLGDDTMSTSSMAALATSLQMNVDLFNNWQVTYSGRILMSSNNSSYWPACLAYGCTTAVPGKAGPGVDPNFSSEVLALNNAFRWCPSVNAGDTATLLSTPLGCDGNTATTSTLPNLAAIAELNVLKWRVTHALWMMGVSAGDARDGMFNMPVPVATNPMPTPSLVRIPQIAMYNGQLVQSSDPSTCAADRRQIDTCLNAWNLSQGSASNHEVYGMGTVYDVAPEFTVFTTHAGSEIPSWYMSMYAQPSLKHKYTGTPDIPFFGCAYLTGTTGTSPDACLSGGKAPDAAPIALSSMMDMAFNLDQVACSARSGDPTVITSTQVGGTFPFWQWIATATNVAGIDDYFHWGVMPHIPEQGSTLLFTYYQTDDNNFPTARGVDGKHEWISLDPDMASVGQSFASVVDSPPAARARFFITDTAQRSTCGAINQIVQAATIACASQGVSIPMVNPSQPPVITQPSDIVALEGWLGVMQKVVLANIGKLYAEQLPSRVVADFQNGTVGTGDKRGSKGAALLDLEAQMNTLPSSWSRISSDIGQVKNAIATARLSMTAADLQADATVAQLGLQQIGVEGQMTQAVLGFMGAVTQASASAVSSFGASFANVAVAAAQMQATLDTSSKEMQQLHQLTSIAQKTEGNQVALAMAQLGTTTGPIWSDVQTALDDIRASVAKIMADAQQVQLLQGQAQYQAAIGTGQDFVQIAGQEVAIPVDTVLRRQASATQARYQTALVNAKALAYMARRAIEQRIGVTLDTLTTPVGPLAAPSSWSDDICSLTGVNYKRLMSATPAGADGGGIGGAIDQQVITDFADAWVGDYVAKLRDFVAYYNAQYPSHQGTDTAVLSLRSDLMAPVPQCNHVGPNMLVHSGSLDSTVPPGTIQHGWQLHPCPPGSPKCLTLLAGDFMQSPLDGPNGALLTPSAGSTAAGVSLSTGLFANVATGITWLSEVAAADAPPDAGAPQGNWPANLVSQSVSLDPGSYVLSWWDQARDATGAIASTSTNPSSYAVYVFDASWARLGIHIAPPFVPGAADAAQGTLWSARNTLAFTVTQSGTYRIAFGASSDAGIGNVAIANVQLEAADAASQPSVYTATHDSLVVTSYGCPRSDSDFRSAFEHHCDPSGVCSYDLVLPMLIDTASLNAGTSPLAGKLAQGNINFRHGTIAVNLVGTGVHDCANNPTPNCFGTGYVEYSLEHDATNAGILGYDGNTRAFNFGIATVNHGKALAAERYLTMPLGSNDQSLIAQPGIQHEEFSGRPLDGAYRVRIWDTPSLKWSQLQDIQIVLSYGYWSQIVANGN